MTKTMKERLIAALEARGYVPRINPRGSKYGEYATGPGAKSLLKTEDDGAVRPHRILVGKAGALRFTTKSIADSIPFSDRTKLKLLAEGDAALDPKKGPRS